MVKIGEDAARGCAALVEGALVEDEQVGFVRCEELQLQFLAVIRAGQG